MEEKVHLWAAKLYLEIAEKANADYGTERDSEKKVAWRVVAAQNYFYATVNWIESVFAKNKEHSFNHENRMSKILENPDVGKPMRYSRKGTREVYVSSFRLSYIYYQQENSVIFLDIYHKDEQ